MTRQHPWSLRRALHRARERLHRAREHLGGGAGRGYTPPPPPPDPLDLPPPEGHVPVQPGVGETPGPNNKVAMSADWVGAQLVSGVPPAVIDIRPPADFLEGHVPGALLLPGDLVLRELDALADFLPPWDSYVAVYDQDGGELSQRVAAHLREKGWTLARYVVGGFEEWVRTDEDVERGAAPLSAGSRVRIGETKGLVLGSGGEPPALAVLLDDGTLRFPVAEDELEPL